MSSEITIKDKLEILIIDFIRRNDVAMSSFKVNQLAEYILKDFQLVKKELKNINEIGKWDFMAARDGFRIVYRVNGKTRKYIPDFVLDDGTYLEIKGYYTENVKQKLKYFPDKIIIFFEKDMEIYLTYVIEKYGKNFVDILKDKNCDVV